MHNDTIDDMFNTTVTPQKKRGRLKKRKNITTPDKEETKVATPNV